MKSVFISIVLVYIFSINVIAQTNINVLELSKLSSAGVGEMVIDSYLKSYIIPKTPTVNEIIYLHDSGVSSNIISKYMRISSQLVNNLNAEKRKEDGIPEVMLLRRRQYFFNKEYPPFFKR